MTSPVDRKDALLAVLREGVAQLLDADEGDVDVGAPLTEMGADSLIMVAAVRSIQQLYGIKIKMRRFFEDLDTIEALADYLDHVLPADAVAHRMAIDVAEIAAEREPMRAPDAEPAARPAAQAVTTIATVPDVMPAPPARPSAPLEPQSDAITATLVGQLNLLSQVMLEQLRVLGACGSAAPLPAERPAPEPPPAISEGPSASDLAIEPRRVETVASLPTPVAAATVRRYALTAEQRELWTSAEIESEMSVALNNRVALRLRGPLEPEALRTAVRSAIERHEALRTVFTADGTEALVFDTMPMDVPMLDLTELDPTERDAAVLECMVADSRFPFDRERGPLLRVQLVQCAADDHVLMISSDHVIADGYSMALLLDDLARVYRAERAGEPHARRDPMPFSEYAAWRATLDPEQVAAAKTFWSQQIHGSVGVLDLPYDRPRPSVKTYPGDHEVTELDARSVSAIAAFCKAHHCTPQMVLLAAFKTLLHRLSGNDDIIVGVPFGARSMPGCEEMFGNCTSLGAVRTRLDGDPTFGALVGRVKAALLDAFEHDGVSLTRLPRRNEPGLRASVAARLYTTYFNIDPHPSNLQVGCDVEWVPFPIPFCHPDIFFNIVAAPRGYVVEAQYNTDLLDAVTVRRWLGHFVVLLEHALAAPERPVSEIPLLSDEECRHLLAVGRDASSDGPDRRVLDRHRRPVPIGVAGELYVGRSDAAHADGAADGSGLLATGTLARILPDGRIEDLGRIETHERVHGFRVDVAQMAATLRSLPGVCDAAVALRAGRLVAWAATDPEDAVTAAELHRRIDEALPTSLVLPEVVVLDTIPRTADGDPDWDSLPYDTEGAARDADYVAPRDELERELAGLWEEVLDVRPIGMRDDFFELGGHSLLFVHLVGRVRDRYRCHFALTQLVSDLTVERMASLIREPSAAGPAKEHSMARMLFGSAHPNAAAASADGGDGRSLLGGLTSGDTGVEADLSALTDLHADVALDPDIRADGSPLAAPSGAPRIFLTGATGFVGAFLLHELLQQTDGEIHCLVRAPRLKDATERLRATLAAYGLWDPCAQSRIVPVLGDLSRPRLGLAAAGFRKLAGEIDVIYHAGALVNFFFPYRAVRGANVLGTREVLRLAVLVRTKPVHYVSTLGIFPAIVPPGTVFHENDPLEQFDGLPAGYPQSKWVCDKIVTLARARGVPVTTYRLGRVTGHSRSGACSATDLWTAAIKTCIGLGGAPDVPGAMEMAPVDFVARAVVHLSRQDASVGKVFHIYNGDRIPLADVVEALATFGYSVRQMPPEEWRERLMARSRAADGAEPYANLAMFEQLLPGIVSRLLMYPAAFDCTNTLAGLDGTTIHCPLADRRLVQTYLAWFVRSGFLPAPPATITSTGAPMRETTPVQA